MGGRTNVNTSKVLTSHKNKTDSDPVSIPLGAHFLDPITH